MRIPALAGFALALASCAAPGSAPRTVNPEAEAQFELLESLEGGWVITGQGAAAPAEPQVRYRVAANGSAVVETLFAGTPGEMVTVYHRDGGELVLTHYCALGNQPRMVAVPTGDASTVRFRFGGGSNVDPERDRFMGAVEHRLVDPAHLESTWTMHAQGEPAEVTTFSLVRSWR
jgi:hypothetical protein